MYSGVSGNVGIGTSTPEGRLAVSDEEDADFYTFRVGGLERFSLTAHASGTDYLGIRYRLSDPDLDIAVFDQYGHVGVGTHNPAERLDVAGKVRAQGIILTSSPTAGHVLTSDASGNGTWQPPGELTLPYEDSASASTAAMKITNTGTGCCGCVRPT